MPYPLPASRRCFFSFPAIAFKNFLGHVSLQTTQIYAEEPQDTMNKQLKSWNDKWFLNENKNSDDISASKRIPDFLK